MNKKKVAGIFLLALLASFLWMTHVLASSNEVAAQVLVIKNQEQMRDLKKRYPQAIEIALPERKKGEEVIVFRTMIYPVGIAIYDVDSEKSGTDLKQVLLYEYDVKKNDQENVFILRINVPEGLPNLAVILMGEKNGQHYTWYPRYNGMDGTIILADGFENW